MKPSFLALALLTASAAFAGERTFTNSGAATYECPQEVTLQLDLTNKMMSVPFFGGLSGTYRAQKSCVTDSSKDDCPEYCRQGKFSDKTVRLRYSRQAQMLCSIGMEKSTTEVEITFNENFSAFEAQIDGKMNCSYEIK